MDLNERASKAITTSKSEIAEATRIVRDNASLTKAEAYLTEQKKELERIKNVEPVNYLIFYWAERLYILL